MFAIYRPEPPIQWKFTSLTGPDAADFLHRITTVNVRSLQPGEGAEGCLLNPQGKIRSYFRLWYLAEHQFALESDGGEDGQAHADLLAAIDQYTFAEKMTLKTSDPAFEECRWIFPNVETLEREGLRLEDDRTAIIAGVRVCHHGKKAFGRPWLTAWGKVGELDPWIEKNFRELSVVTFQMLETWRILAARPRLGRELSSEHNPLEIGLRDAVAENKGCYPGQEVIEKIVALGSPARRLARVDGQGQAPAAGARVMNLAEPPVEVGTLTSVVQNGNRFSGLVIVKKIHAKEGLQVQLGEGIQASITRVAPYA